MASELASTNLIPDAHLILDTSLLKVPHEIHRNNLVNARRTFERERDQIFAALKSAANVSLSSSDPQTAQQQTLTSIDAMINRLETLRKKLSSLRAEELTLQKQSRARIEHLQQLYEIPSLADVKYDEWAKVRLNRLLADYLLRSGYGDTAQALAKENGIEDLVDVEAFMRCQRIEASLLQKRTHECLTWCAENSKALKKMESDLEHELRLQQFIELARSQQNAKYLEAIKHGRRYLPSHSDLESGIQAANLLIYPPSTLVEPYCTLYSPQRWTTLAQKFVSTYQSLLCLPVESPLYYALSAGLSALKTPACHSSQISSSSNANTASGTSVCPICSTELNELARKVPYAHHTKSTVEADPVVLPNGRVYGRERLMKWQSKAGEDGLAEGCIRDPTRPDEVYRVEELRKIYVS